MRRRRLASGRRFAHASSRALAFETRDRAQSVAAKGARSDLNMGARHAEHAALIDAIVQVVQIAGDAGLVRMGTLAVDGSKIRANARAGS